MRPVVMDDLPRTRWVLSGERAEFECGCAAIGIADEDAAAKPAAASGEPLARKLQIAQQFGAGLEVADGEIANEDNIARICFAIGQGPVAKFGCAAITHPEFKARWLITRCALDTSRIEINGDRIGLLTRPRRIVEPPPTESGGATEILAQGYRVIAVNGAEKCRDVARRLNTEFVTLETVEISQSAGVRVGVSGSFGHAGLLNYLGVVESSRAGPLAIFLG